MKFRLDYIALGLFAATLVHNCWYWGGARHLKEIGPIIQSVSEHEAPLVQTYAVIGDLVLGWTGMRANAVASAEAAFGPARARILEAPQLTMESLFNEKFSPALSRLTATHLLCPLALLLWAVGWWLRPRKIQTIKTGQRR